MLTCDGPLRPFVWLNRMAPEIMAVSDPQLVYQKGQWSILGTARGCWVPSLPHLAYLQAATAD